MILELVGAQNLSENLDALAIGGRISIIGVGAGPKTEINLHKLMIKEVDKLGHESIPITVRVGTTS